MMKKLLITISFILSIGICSGQTLYIDEGVDTTESKVFIAIRFYKQYLGEIKYNKLPDFKQYWRAKDLQGNKYPDPLLFALGTGFPTYLMSERKTLFYAKPKKDYVHLKTLFASADTLGSISITCITNHFIGFDSISKPYFISPIEINTNEWKQSQRRNILFFYPPYHHFSSTKADDLITQVIKLEKDWSLAPIPIRYYFADTKEELQKLKGFDFALGMGNSDVPSGIADDNDNIIYAAGMGEGYFHEVVHIYLNRQFPKSPLREGLATFYGGSLGKKLSWHLDRLNEYLQMHPEIDLNKFRDYWYWDRYTNPNNVIEGLLCLLIYQKDGLEGLKRIMSYTSLEDVFLKEFGVEKNKWNLFLREAINSKQFKAYNTGLVN